MTLAIWFWVIYIIGIILGAYYGYRDRSALPTSIWLLVLLFIIGLAEFGSPVK